MITDYLNCHQLHDRWLQAGTGVKVNKRFVQIPDTGNLKLLIPAFLEGAVKAMDIDFTSSLNTSGSHCRRISLNRSGCPLFSVWLYCMTPAGNQIQMQMLYCKKNSTPISGRYTHILRLKGVHPGQILNFKRKLETSGTNQRQNMSFGV